MKIINYIGRFGCGGIEEIVSNISCIMEESIHCIILAKYRTKNIYQKRLEDSGCEVVYLSKKKQNRLWSLIDIFSFFARHKDDVLCLHASNSSIFLYAFLAKISGIKKLYFIYIQLQVRRR